MVFRQVNDAVLVCIDDDLDIYRVMAVTEDGRCVIKDWSDNLKLEDQPGAWSKVGYYLPIPNGLFSWGCEPKYKFCPTPTFPALATQ